MSDGSVSVVEYTLSTAWDISTASYLQSFSVSGQESSPQAVSFKSDGTKMYVMGRSGDDVNEYSLSTAWDISTASYTQVFSVAVQDTEPRGLFLKPDGSAMYVSGYIGVDVNQYTIGGFSVATEENNPRGVFFKEDGTKMYVVGTGGDDVNEYSLSTAWDTSTASYVRVFDTGTVEGTPNDIFIKPDGTTLYLCGAGLDGVSQWSMSTPWDVSTLSHVQTFDTSAQSVVPRGLFFKPDGTEMYIMHQSATIFVSQYSLSTAWDISTASFSQSFDVSTYAPGGSGVFFKPDGTKMFVVGTSSTEAVEYNLSTAWDIFTASYSTSFDHGLPLAQGFFFHPDGIQMFLISSSRDGVQTYTLGVQ